MRSTIRIATATLAVALALASFLAPAAGAQGVEFSVGLSPERLGSGTTMEFSVRIPTPGGHATSPLKAMDLSYPANLGIITSGLGLRACPIATLEESGRTACPPDALMGYGTVGVQIPDGLGAISETGNVTIWMGPEQEGHLQLLFYANAQNPVIAQLLFAGEILEGSAPYGGNLATQIPEIPNFPGAPPPAVVSLNASIGPKDVVYARRIHGSTIHYTPKGLRLPDRCPRGGFPFAATFIFLDGTSATDRTAVPCPAKSGVKR